MTRKRAAQSPEYAVSDEAAAYIADALMEIALQFEASHFAQIRRHYKSITPERDDDRWQLDVRQTSLLNAGNGRIRML